MVMRFLFLLLFLAPAGIASAQGSPQEAIAQPNILWIVGENFALDLGCYGAPNVETPNLDRLAGKFRPGMAERAFVPTGARRNAGVGDHVDNVVVPRTAEERRDTFLLARPREHLRTGHREINSR